MLRCELLILTVMLFLSGTACEQDRITKKTESRKNVQQKKVQQLVPPRPKPKNLSVKQSTQQNQIDSFSEESSTEDNTDLQSDITSPSSEHILSSKNIEETTSEDPIEISKREGELREPLEAELPAKDSKVVESSSDKTRGHPTPVQVAQVKESEQEKDGGIKEASQRSADSINIEREKDPVSKDNNPSIQDTYKIRFRNRTYIVSKNNNPPAQDTVIQTDKKTIKEEQKGSSTSEPEKFNTCDVLPQSLNTSLEKQLGKPCHLFTKEDLTHIKRLKISHVPKKEWDLFHKEHAQYFLSLEELDLSDNPEMLFLPSFVTDMVWLKELNISNTGINDFSEELCQLEALKILRASHNNYKDREVPFHTFCLKSLKVLDMSSSSLRYIDEYIGKLSFLEELYMSKNSLLLVPYMLSVLSSSSSLVLVDFRDNNLYDEDLNVRQSCKGFKGEEREECQEDLSDSMKCDNRNELPFDRKEPLRLMYIKLAFEKEDLILKQCEKNKEDGGLRYCPPFITKCRDYPESDKLECMMDEFQNPRQERERDLLYRDMCYATWLGFLVDYEKYPELLNKTIRGKTIREVKYASKYVGHFDCWEMPWDNLYYWGGLIDTLPKKYATFAFEFAPHSYRIPGLSSRVTARLESEGGFFNPDILWWVPEDCPHLYSNLKERVYEAAYEYERRKPEMREYMRDSYLLYFLWSSVLRSTGLARYTG